MSPTTARSYGIAPGESSSEAPSRVPSKHFPPSNRCSMMCSSDTHRGVERATRTLPYTQGTMAPITFQDLQNAIDRWISQFEAGYWSPLANLARLTEEVGELSREINHLHGPKKKKSEEERGSIAEELGDILFTVATLANSMDIDLDAVVRRNMEKVVQRDTARWQKKSE